MRTEDGFHLAAGGLEDAAVTAQAVADGVSGLDLGRPFRAAAAALAGSATADAAAAVIASWRSHAITVARDLAAHADALAASADTYRLADGAVVDIVAPPSGR